MANTLSNQLDLPFWELLNQAPVASSALSAVSTTESGMDRYIYYYNSTTLYRYDTYKDTWQQLANSPAAASTIVGITHTQRRGTHGRVLAVPAAVTATVTAATASGTTSATYTATNTFSVGQYVAVTGTTSSVGSFNLVGYVTAATGSQFTIATTVTAGSTYTSGGTATVTSLTIGGLRLQNLQGETLSFEYGTGQGQSFTIGTVTDTIADSGVITGTTTSTLVDSTKKWRYNQWAGYTVGITFGTDATQYRRVIYNDTTTLYISDYNLQPHDPWGQQVFTATAPYALPVTTAGSQTHYTISSQTVTLSAPFSITPDTSTFWTTRTGGLYMVTSAAATPFFNFYYYDIANDQWAQKTTPQTYLLAALAGDQVLERTGNVLASPLVSKVGAITTTAKTLTDAGLALTNDRYANHTIQITGDSTTPAAIGQKRRIVAHSATTFTVTPAWTTTPSTNATYSVLPNLDKVWFIPGNNSGMFQYDAVTDNWAPAEIFDQGVATNISATLNGWAPIGVTSITRIASGVVSVNPTPVAAGSGYVIGDILTLSTGGAGAQVIVTSVTSAGAVNSVTLINSGTTTGYTVTTSATTGGTGTACTISITAIGPTANVVTASNHFFKSGDSVTIAGCATDTTFNAAFTVIGPSAVSTFSISAPSSTASPTATSSQGTTTLVDASKNWTTNEHVGRLVAIFVSGINPTTQVSWITANTATTLTLASTITAAVNGTSKYVLHDAKLFGTDDMLKTAGKQYNGWATSGSTTTLVDSTKSWTPGQWVGHYFKIEAGTGYAVSSTRIAITANDATSLTFATQSFTPDTTTKYEIADSWGLVTTGTSTTVFTDTAHNWPVNIYAGKRLRFTAGTVDVGYENTITSNTVNTITLGTAAASTPVATTSAYCIIGAPARVTGIEMLWNWGSTDTAKTARYFYSPRGGATNGAIDIYDIPSGKWILAPMTRSQSELWQLGSAYAYDGADTIYLTRTASGAVVRVFRYDLNAQQINGAATTTMLSAGATAGNKMALINTATGNKFLYVLQDTGTQFTRALVW